MKYNELKDFFFYGEIEDVFSRKATPVHLPGARISKQAQAPGCFLGRHPSCGLEDVENH